MRLDPQAIDRQILFRAGDGEYAAYRIPGIIATEGGTLIACCENRSDKKSDWGKIDISVIRSADEGKTWKRCLLVENTSKTGGMNTLNNPTLIADGELVHLIYHLNYERAFIITSADEGAAWSSEREITDVFRRFAWRWNVVATGPGHGIRLKSGRLAAPVWLANGAYNQDGTRLHFPSVAGYIYSDDRGKSWQPGPLITGLLNANETSIAEMETGLLLNIRTMEEMRKRYIAFLPDGEDEYAFVRAAQELDDPMCFGSMISLSDGVVLFVNCGCQNARRELTAHISYDAGVSWGAGVGLDQAGGYADIACLNDKLFVFFERNALPEKSVRDITLKIFRLTI